MDLDGRHDEQRASDAAEPTALQTMDEVAARLQAEAVRWGWKLLRAHPLVLLARRDSRSVLIVPSQLWTRKAELLSPFIGRTRHGSCALIVLGKLAEVALEIALVNGLYALLPWPAPINVLCVAINSALMLIDARVSQQQQSRELSRYRYELGELVEIARMLSKQQETTKLLGLILEKARYISGADAGSIYVVEHGEPGQTDVLRFKLTQNDSLSFDWREFTIPINVRSIAGASALDRKSINLPDVTRLPAHSPYTFDSSFDEKIGYRTRSMLCVPLVSKNMQVIGVLQLINKKRRPQSRLHTEKDFDAEVIAFDHRSQTLLEAMAAQAGVSLENAMLYEEIMRIFDGFVHASVEAIEQRDPTTSGHSRRVAKLSVYLAQAVIRTTTGPYATATFSDQDLQELKYASLLHDFGKIGVRERVLVKSHKLYPWDLTRLKNRFAFARLSYQTEMLQRQLQLVRQGASDAELAHLTEDFTKQIARLDQAWHTISQANEPSILPQDLCDRLRGLDEIRFRDEDGNEQPLVTDTELANLRIPKGSLNDVEFAEIRAHVEHTYRFLRKIPWGTRFARIPEIAGAHHERLDGTGYPRGIMRDQIPLQSKIMSIADIFDALTASDRPYKKAVPVERALEILTFEAKDNHVDEDLLKLFVEAKVWEMP